DPLQQHAARLPQDGRQLLLEGAGPLGRGRLPTERLHLLEENAHRRPQHVHEVLQVWACRRRGGNGRVGHGELLSWVWLLAEPSHRKGPRFATSTGQVRYPFVPERPESRPFFREGRDCTPMTHLSR